MLRSGFAALGAILTGGLLLAQDEPPEGPKARASLVAEREALVPGRINHIGIRLQIEPEWHVYFDGLNDTGLPLQAVWSAPEGVEIGKIVWPAPKRYVLGDFSLDHIYEGEVLLPVPVRVDETLAGERVEISAELSWLICDEICLLESAEVALDAEVAAPGAEPGFGKARRLFQKAWDRLPRAPDADGPRREIRVRVQGATMTVEAENAEEIIFYPGPSCSQPSNLIADGAVRGDRLTVRFDREPERVEGLIEARFGDSMGGDSVEIVPIPRPSGDPGGPGR